MKQLSELSPIEARRYKELIIQYHELTMSNLSKGIDPEIIALATIRHAVTAIGIREERKPNLDTWNNEDEFLNDLNEQITAWIKSNSQKYTSTGESN
jgi:hypothetical protein